MTEIVLDAGVWNHWSSQLEEDEYSYQIVETFLEGETYCLLLDKMGVILDECKRQVGRDFFLAIKNCWERIELVEAQLDEIYMKSLKSRGFHENTDLVYVGVANKSGKLIITLDGDYGIFGMEYYRSLDDYEKKYSVYRYLLDVMHLEVYSPKDYIQDKRCKKG